MTDTEILDWIDRNPEGFRIIVVRKTWGRKVWWIGPDEHACHTLRECVTRAAKSELRTETGVQDK